MTQRNSYRNSNSNSNFDLDDYIEKKANSDSSREYNSEKVPSRSSNWFRNTLVILGFGVVTLLYFNNWSPKQVYGNIFGIEEYQAATQAPSPTASTTQPTIIDLPSGLEGQLADLNRLEELEGLEALEGLEGLESLEASIAGLEELEDMNKLREFALNTAMQALEGIGSSPEFSELIGEASQLGIQEALKELEKLREMELEGAEGLAEQAGNLNLSLIQYSEELTKIGLNEPFNNASIQKFHEAQIPVSFLEKINEQGLLETMTPEGIIEAYQKEGN
jgi:hypothetical protein